MPVIKYCAEFPCPNEVPRGQAYCKEHRKKTARGWARTPAQDAFYKSCGWQIQRRLKLAACLICERCCEQSSTDVHHRIPLTERPDLGLTMSNLEALCHSCHSKETIEEVRRRRGKA